MSQAQATRTIDGFTFTWPDIPILISLTRIRESSRGTQAEFIAQLTNGPGKAKTLTHQSMNLLSSKARLIKELAARHDAPWLSMLEQVCILALRELRKGEPIESLQPGEDSDPAGFVLNPLLYQHNPTVLYGPGDSMKSFFALYCALLLANGLCGPNLNVAPTPWRVLFLDWEMSVQDVRGRVKLLQAGDARLQQVPDYRRCYLPLADDIAEIKKVISEGHYDVLILDSLAMAAGGQELEKADAAIRFNAALRALHVTSLIIGHTPKPQEGQTERSLYGSVFFHNLCRVSWECRREGDIIGLYQRKNNLGPKQEALGFELHVNEQSCEILPADLTNDPILSTQLPYPERIEALLKKGACLTASQIAAELGAKLETVRKSLQRGKDHRWLQLSAKNGEEAAWTTV
jgi:hypothetical protein